MYVHGDWHTAFDADDVSTARQWGESLDRILAAYGPGDEDEQRESGEDDLDAIGGGTFQ